MIQSPERYLVRLALCPCMVEDYGEKFSRMVLTLNTMRGIRQDPPLIVSFEEFVFPHNKGYLQVLEKNRYQIILDADRMGASYVLKVCVNYLEGLRKSLQRRENIPFAKLPLPYVIVNVIKNLLKELTLEEFKIWWVLSTPDGWQPPAPTQKGRT